VVPSIYADGELLAPLWDVIASTEFRQGVAALPGYDVSRMGTLVAEVG
jgi:hypothetical protein